MIFHGIKRRAFIAALLCLGAQPADAHRLKLRIFGKGSVVPPIVGQLPVLPAALMGMNEGSLTSSDWSRDLFYSSRWYANSNNNNTDFGLDLNGRPHQFPTNSTVLRLGSNGARPASRTGVYTVTYSPADQPVSLETNGGCSVVQAFSNGVGKINIPATSSYFTLSFSGSQANFASSGISVSIMQDGDTGTGFYNAHAAAAMAALGKINRSMDPRPINGDTLGVLAGGKGLVMRTASTISRGPIYHSGMSLEQQLDCCIKGGTFLWHNASILDDDTVHQQNAQLVANSSYPIPSAIFLEHGNEYWNTAFHQGRIARYLGVRAGLAPLNANPASLTPEQCIINYSGSSIWTISSVTLYRVENGENIMMLTNSGYLVFKCVNAAGMDAGATITSLSTEGATTTDGNWQLVYNGNSTYRAFVRYIGKRSKEMWAIWDAALAAAGRPRAVHCVGHQAGTGLTGFVTNILDWDDVASRTDRVSVGPYFGGGVGNPATGPNYMGDYNINNSVGPWTQTQKDLITSDVPAFTNAYLTAAYKSADAAVEQYAALKNQLVTYLSSKGLPAGSAKMNCYECGDHGLLSNWPTAAQTNLNTWYGDNKRSQAYADLMTYYFQKLLAVGGEICAFIRITPYSDSGRLKSSFGMYEYEGVLTPQYQAVANLNTQYAANDNHLSRRTLLGAA